MKIRFKLPAVAIDDDGHEQEIELLMEMDANYYLVEEHQVNGDFHIVTNEGGLRSSIGCSFSFHEEHPFNSKYRPIRKP